MPLAMNLPTPRARPAQISSACRDLLDRDFPRRGSSTRDRCGVPPIHAEPVARTSVACRACHGKSGFTHCVAEGARSRSCPRPAFSAFTRVHSPVEEGLNALNRGANAGEGSRPQAYPSPQPFPARGAREYTAFAARQTLSNVLNRSLEHVAGDDIFITRSRLR